MSILLRSKQDASGFKEYNLNIHYLKLDTVFFFMWLKQSSCSHSLLCSFRTCPLRVSLTYFLAILPRIVTRRQTRSKTEQQDTSLLTPPHLCMQPLQEHIEAFCPKAFQSSQLSLKVESIIYPRISVLISQGQSPFQNTYYC